MGGKTSNASKAKYNEKSYDRISLAVVKGRKDEIKAAAEAEGMSINAFIAAAIDVRLGK